LKVTGVSDETASKEMTMATGTATVENLTAAEMATYLKEQNPTMRFAHHPNMVGLWSAELGRFWAIFTKALCGEWVRMPYELMVNGKPLACNWQEV
jgi:hypothetical protein